MLLLIIDAITNQNVRLAALTNKDNNHKDKLKKLEELLKERFDEIKELTDEINQNDLTYYFKSKRFHDFNNGIELYQKIKSGEIKPEEAKILQNVFKSNLNEISRGRLALRITRSCY